MSGHVSSRTSCGPASAVPRGLRALPDFPWDSLVPYRERAAEHPEGVADLSIGTPVDPTPQVVQRALAAATDAPGYPQTSGTPQLREAVAAWFARRRLVPDVNPDSVLPTIGSKELVAWLPTLLGLGPGDLVGIPKVAYPTYDVGARLAGAQPVVVDGPESLRETLAESARGGTRFRLLWLNSPGNPTGSVLDVDYLAETVALAREHEVIVANDECYAELDWRAPDQGGPKQPGGPGSVPSILAPEVCGGDHTGLLAVYSLSKQSNLAGYRAAFTAGDVAVTKELLEVRKHAGMMLPAPISAAMLAALADDEHVADQRERYRRRRDALVPALTGAGFRIDDSQAGLYLWATRGTDCWDVVSEFADLGIVVGPGTFYGPAGSQHVRVALTATDEAIATAVQRLT